jgi:hypothetical protein
MSTESLRARTLWGCLIVTAACLLVPPVIKACSWSYKIWAIRSKSADPLFRFVRDGKAGYIDARGKIVIQPTFPVYDNFFGEFHEGLLAVKEESGYRYVDRSGTTAFHADGWMALDFSEGLAPVAEGDAGHKWGFIDRTGKFAIRPQYSWANEFSDGLARVELAGEVGSTGYIDRHGNFVLPPRLTYGSDFHEGLAAVILNGPCRIINGGSCARPEFRPTQAGATYDCRWSFVDKNGTPISTMQFDDAKDFTEGVAPVRVGPRWGFVDHSGQVTIAPQYGFAESFSEGLALVYLEGKMGFIDHSGVFVIAPQFEDAEPFADGLALVSASGEKGARRYWFIGKNGKEAFPGTYDSAASFSHGLAPVSNRGTLAWINTVGRAVFRFRPR